MTSKWFRTGRRKQRTVKYDEIKFQGGGTESTVRVLFLDTVSANVKETWKANSSMEKNCCALRSALTETAKGLLGKSCADILTGSERLLKPWNPAFTEESGSMPST